MKYKDKTVKGWRKTVMIIATGLAALVTSTSLGGCTKPEYETRIETCIQNPDLDRLKKETLAIYKNINPKNLTETQKEYLACFERDEKKYTDRLFPWMNQNNLTVQDKIYLIMDEDSAGAMLNAVAK